MSVETVKAYLEKRGLGDRVIEFDVSSATVELAALAVGCEPCRIAKSLTFYDPAGDGCVMILAAGDARIDNPKFKAVFGGKAKMLSAEDVPAFTGHAIGGVCPFGVGEKTKVYLDASLKRFDVVYPAAGSAQSAVRLTLPELEEASGSAGWIDVCKLPQGE